MKYNYINKHKLFKFTVFTIIIILIYPCFFIKSNKARANMPFYDLQPQNIVLRSKFYTSYSSSSEERKNNIKIAASSLDKIFIDVNEEFSFNKTVGARTEEKGYKISKIIVGGEFVDGIGGGVCQVSTTLYNAVLLSGLRITEYHPHSLPVSYVSPSFDAMVSYNFADLKFINNTHNPLILHTIATNNSLTVEIYGETNEYTYSRQSIIIEEIPAPKEAIIFDEKGEYPELYEGQQKVLKYSKAGIKSQGFLLKNKNGNIVDNKKIRSDVYNPTQGLIISGKTPYPNLFPNEGQESQHKTSLIDFIKNIINKQKIL